MLNRLERQCCIQPADSKYFLVAWLYKRDGSKFWWLGWRTPDGKPHFRSTRCQDRTEAQKQLAGVEALFSAHRSEAPLEAVYLSLAGRATPRVTVKAALADWLTECEGSNAVNTQERYGALAEAFAAHLGASDKGPMLDAISTEHVRTFLTQRRASRSASTVNSERKFLSVFFIRAFKNGLLKANPVAAIKTLKLSAAERQRKRAFTLDELKTIFAKCPNDFWRFMVLGGFYLGQRMGDLVCLTWGSVDFGEDILRLTQGKTGRTVQVPLRPALRSLLAALRVKVGKVKPSDFLWPEHAERYQRRGAGPFSNEFYEILAACGLVPARSHKPKNTKKGVKGPRQVTPVSFHCLRHTFISVLKATGGSQAVAKELAGHSSDAISDLYTHTDTATLAKAIAALPELTV